MAIPDFVLYPNDEDDDDDAYDIFSLYREKSASKAAAAPSLALVTLFDKYRCKSACCHTRC
jgi:hypothetical protein